MNQEIVMQVVRYAIVGLGGLLTQRGIGDASTYETIAGGATALVGVAYGIYVKWGSKAVPVAHIEASIAPIPVQSPLTGVVK